MTQEATKVWTEEQKVLLTLARTMDGSLLKWDDSTFYWHGNEADNVRDRAAAYLLKRCLTETDIQFQDLAARVAITTNDPALLREILPRLDIRYSACDSIVTRAVKSHNPEFYNIVREFWRTIEPDPTNQDNTYVGHTYHLRFCDALEIALKSGTPEVFDVVYKEFNDDMDPMVAVKASNWELVGHLLGHYTILPGKLAEMTNALRVAKKDDLVQRAKELGFRPMLERDPYENIIDMVHEDDFQKMLLNTEKIQVLPREAAYRLVKSGQYDRIEAVLKTLSEVAPEKKMEVSGAFIQGLYDMLYKFREQGKYKELAELFRLFKEYGGEYGYRSCYSIENYFSAAAANSDINAVETFFNSGLTFNGIITVHDPPQPASPAFVKYLIANGHREIAGRVVQKFLDFDHSAVRDGENQLRENFYFKCIEENLIHEETFKSLLPSGDYHRQRHIPVSIVEHIVLTKRIDEPTVQLMLRIWPGHMTPKLMEYFLGQSKEEVLRMIKWEDWGKYFAQNKQVGVMELLIAAGHEVTPTERATATKSKDEAMIALLSRKKSRKKSRKSKR